MRCLFQHRCGKVMQGGNGASPGYRTNALLNASESASIAAYGSRMQELRNDGGRAKRGLRASRSGIRNDRQITYALANRLIALRYPAKYMCAQQRESVE
jgi:hypothetical protein